MTTKKKAPERGTPEWHQLQIAKQTVKMNEVMAQIMGSMSPKEAQEIINEYK